MEHDTQRDDDTYSPVTFDRAEALARAWLRPGFNEAWDALEEEYAALGALIEARKAAGVN